MRNQFGFTAFPGTELFSHDVHVTWGINPETNGVWTNSYNGDRDVFTDQDSFAWLP